MSYDLRCGDYRETLADVRCDLLLTDCPYSAKTHSGHDEGKAGVQPSAKRAGGYVCPGGAINAAYERRGIDYSHFTAADVNAFVDFWAPRCTGWMVSLTDDVLFPVWRDAMERAGRQVFQDVACVVQGMSVRLSGDGPSSWVIHAAVSRPRNRAFASWGTLPGAYVGPSEPQPVVGGKPLWLMKRLVEDYSRPGDTVCDPCAGGGTTLLAARQLGRVAVGSELDPATYAKAKARLDRAWVPDMFATPAQTFVDDLPW